MSQIDSGSSAATSVEYPNSRKIFWANGRHWVFYSDGINIVYCTSLDGINWTLPTIIQPCDYGFNFSVWFDGIYLHYARYDSASYDLYYRRGTPNADGSITWSTAAEQTVYNGSATLNFSYPVIIVDSGGYPWIGTQYYTRIDTTDYYYPSIWKSSRNDGVWATQAGFPYSPPALPSAITWNTLLVPLTNQRVYFMYARINTRILGRLWSGAAPWGAEEFCSTSNTYLILRDSAVGQGDNVHLVFLTSSPYHIRHVIRTFGVGWGIEVAVQNNCVSGTSITLGRHQSTNDLYAWWTYSPTADHIYYKRYNAATATWDVNPTDWYTQLNLYSVQINAHYMDYRTNYLCVAWGWYNALFLTHVSYLCLQLVVAPPPKAGLHPSKIIPLIIDE